MFKPDDEVVCMTEGLIFLVKGQVLKVFDVAPDDDGDPMIALVCDNILVEGLVLWYPADHFKLLKDVEEGL